MLSRRDEKVTRQEFDQPQDTFAQGSRFTKSVTRIDARAITQLADSCMCGGTAIIFVHDVSYYPLVEVHRNPLFSALFVLVVAAVAFVIGVIVVV